MIPKFSYIFLYISRMFVTWISKLIKREVSIFISFEMMIFLIIVKKSSMAAEPLLMTVVWFTLIFPSSMSLVIRQRLQLPTPTHIMTSNAVWPYCNLGLPSWKQGSEKLFLLPQEHLNTQENQNQAKFGTARTYSSQK